MGWLASIGVGILASIVGLVAGGMVAERAVAWYHISSFEGGSGYFVVGMALVGLMGGFVLGVITSRVIAARPRPTFVKALGASAGVVVLAVALIGGWARLLADVPPEIDGETLTLLVELRWPASGGPPLRGIPGVGTVRLGAASGQTVRTQVAGPLFVEDAREDGGRLIVPGAVGIFTSRGERILDFSIGDKALGGFIAPVPAHPGPGDAHWSEWMPRAAPGAAPLPDGFTYRFRVVRESEAIRTDVIGSFDVATSVSDFYNVVGSERYAARSRFAIRYRGQPVEGLGDADGVAVVAGDPAALLVHPDRPDRGGVCVLVTDEGQRAAVRTLGDCMSPIDGRPLTSDVARFHQARSKDVVPGWIDRQTFAVRGLYQIDRLILDTAHLTSALLTVATDPSPIPSLPPIGLSPDERSLVWFAHDGSEDKPVLGVTDWKTGRSYFLPIDRSRMRFNRFEALDPAWVLHHFTWHRGADGADVLVERTGVAPLPYRGDLTLARPGAYQSYTLQPGGEPLRKAVVELLVSDLNGTRLADESGGYVQRVQVDGKQIDVTLVESPGYVSVSMDGGGSDPALMTRIAERLNIAMATGRYDPLFVRPNEPQR